jgi:hypothetical protein
MTNKQEIIEDNEKTLCKTCEYCHVILFDIGSYHGWGSMNAGKKKTVHCLINPNAFKDLINDVCWYHFPHTTILECNKYKKIKRLNENDK